MMIRVVVVVSFFLSFFLSFYYRHVTVQLCIRVCVRVCEIHTIYIYRSLYCLYSRSTPICSPHSYAHIGKYANELVSFQPIRRLSLKILCRLVRICHVTVSLSQSQTSILKGAWPISGQQYFHWSSFRSL